jgi:RNA polymerase sigma factor (sigma-70 family)
MPALRRARPAGDAVASLARAARDGDDDAFAALVRAYQDVAVAYATSLLGDYHLAEDAAQEAFADAWRALPALREPAAFGAWLRTIVRKRCGRVTRRRQLRTTGLDAALGLASPAPSPHEALERRETRAALHAAIATLSGAEQQAVLLYYMGDHSHRAIAEFLGVTPNAIKTRLYTARQRLRRHMGEIEEGLRAARPSGTPEFAERVRRLIRPAELARREPLVWSPGIGADVWELFCASITGDVATVRRLVERDPSLVRAHHEYRTALSFAVRENQLAVAEFLLDHGAGAVKLGDPREMARDRGHAEMLRLLERRLDELHGVSTRGDPVAAAIRARDLPAVRALLDASPELAHAADATGNRPIHWATMSRQPEVIDELLARGADIDARRPDGARPIHLANGDYDYRGWRDVPADVTATPDDVYRHLVARGAAVDLGMAALEGDLARVRALLAEDPSRANRVSDYGSYYAGSGAPLKNAAVGGHLAIVRLLLQHGADPNLPEEHIAPRGHALYAAVYNGHHEIARLLLEHGAYPNAPVESSADAVWIAIRRGDRRMLELLASYGATWEIPAALDGALTYADVVATGVGRTMEILASHGDVDEAAARLAADPALADDPAALAAAAGAGHEAFVRLLLAHQPDLARRVTVSRPRAMAELLFAHGMDPDRPNWLRITPLHGFAARGDVESAALFLDHGADLHARDEEYRSTPLAWAAREGEARMVEFLLRRGARAELPDDPSWATPLAWATRRGHGEIVALLTGALPRRGLTDYEAVARDLVEAYDSGEAGAMRRTIAFFRAERPMTWDRPPLTEQVRRLRRHVGERLGAPQGDALSPDAARLLVARAHGYADWGALAADVAAS